MTGVRHIRIGVPSRCAGRVGEAVADAVRREVGAVLAVTSPGPRVDVVAAEAEIRIDGERLRLPRDPWPSAPDALACAVAWPVFRRLVERRPAGPHRARVASVGRLPAAHINQLNRLLGLRLDPIAELRPAPRRLDGPRLVIDGVISPILDSGDGAERGDRTASGVLRRLAARLVGDLDVVDMLDAVQQLRPQVAAAMRVRFASDLLTEVVRLLVDEGVSLVHRRLLCEAMLAVNCTLPTALDRDHIIFASSALGVVMTDATLPHLPAHIWAQCVRERLRDLNASTYSEETLDFTEPAAGELQLYRPVRRMQVGLLDLGLERRIQEERLSDRDADVFLDQLATELSGLPVTGDTPVPLLTTASVRYPVWRLTREVFPDLPVLAYQDFAPDVDVVPLFRITSQPSVDGQARGIG